MNQLPQSNKRFWYLPSLTFCVGLTLGGLALVKGPTRAEAEPPAAPEAEAAAGEEASTGAELVYTTDNIQPQTSFRVVFDQPVISYAEAGYSPEQSPVTITPDLPGKFTWESMRSGTFTPTAPLKLGTTYEFKMSMKARGADAAEAPLVLDSTVETPGFEVNGTNPRSASAESSAYSQPTIQVLFNAPVDAATAAPKMHFVSNAGQSIPAVVTPAMSNQNFPRYYSKTQSLLTWDEHFAEFFSKKAAEETAQNSGEEGEGEGESNGGESEESNEDGPAPAIVESETPPTLVANRLTVTPQTPLFAGASWDLVIEEGLPAKDGGMALTEAETVTIGTVKPFEVSGIEGENVLNRPKVIHVNFSKELSEDSQKDEVLAKHITVTPAPANLKITADDSTSVRIDGDFALDTNYEVQVKRGLAAAEPFVVGQDVSEDVLFKKLPPRLYLPLFTEYQMAHGNRALNVLSLNLPQFTLKARRFSVQELIGALQDYASYYKTYSDDGYATEPYRGINYNTISGEEIYNKVTDAASDVDLAREIKLNWDDILGADQPGAVCIMAESPDKKLATQGIVQITDIGLIWKEGEKTATVMAFSLNDASPKAGAEISLRGKEGQVFASGRTDANGLCELPLSRTPDYVAAQLGPDIFVAQWGYTHNVDLYGFGVPYRSWRSSSDAHNVYLFTERGVYKPGETVHVKGILRDIVDGRFTLPQATTVNLTVRDPRWEESYNQDISVKPNGSIDCEIPITKTAALGSYSLTVKIGDEASYSETFMVQEFEPNAFKVTLPDTEELNGPGGAIMVAGKASYYQGANLTKARVKWSIDASDTSVYDESFSGFQFSNYLRYNGIKELYTSRTLQGETTMGPDGTFNISADIGFNPQVAIPRSGSMLVEVTDLNQQTVSETVYFTRYPASATLGLQSLPELVYAKDPLPLNFVAVNAALESAPVMPVDVTLSRVEWKSTSYKSAGGAMAYRSEPYLVEVAKYSGKTIPLEKKGDKWVLPAKPESIMIEVPEDGSYVIEATAKDAEGRPTQIIQSFEAEGPEPMMAAYRTPTTLEIIPDKKEYNVGDTARLLIRTPIKGRALITLERNEVTRTMTQVLEAGETALEIPIEKGFAPNIMVSVIQVRGAADSTYQVKVPHYRVGLANLIVDKPEDKLSVKVASLDSEFRPGAKIPVTATVTDWQGNAVEGAEVTLYAVDEGVLSLTDYATPDPQAHFLQVEPLTVKVGCTIPQLFHEINEALRYGNKGFIVGGGGLEGQTEVRKNFQSVALWQASLKTGKDGRAGGEFTAPDNLTEFRLMAVVTSGSTAFGSGESSVKVNKPVMIEGALPVHANLGDRILLKGVVFNQTDKDLDVVASVQLDGKVRPVQDLQAPLMTADQIGAASREIPAKISKTIRVPAKSQEVLEVPADFIDAGEAVWTWSAEATPPGAQPFKDAVETRLTVDYPAPILRESFYKLVEGKGGDEPKTNLTKPVNPMLLEGSGHLDVYLANSRMVELNSALKYVLHYPYGCVEQTTSSTVPWIVLNDVRENLPDMAGKTDAEVRDAVDNGIQRLLKMQTGDGGLAYWPGGGTSHPWGSAYGGMALAMASTAGYEVPEKSMERLATYLSNSLRESGEEVTDYELSTRCFAAFTLALMGKPEASYHETLFSKRKLLTYESRSVLALAILTANGPKDMVKTLLGDTEKAPDYEDYWFGSITRQSAMRLFAWTMYKPKDPMVEKLANDLFDKRKSGRWDTTQTNLWSLLALSSYVKQVEGPTPAETKVQLAYAGATVPLNMTKKAPFVLHSIEFPVPGTAPQEIDLTGPKKGRAYTNLSIEARPRTFEVSPQSYGMNISREYYELTDDDKLIPPDDLKPGDRVLVKLKVNCGKFATYVAIDDALPSILEAINPDFATQQTKSTSHQGNSYWYYADHQEIRPDRVLYFVDYFYPGTAEFTYLARVRAQGTARAPAMKAEMMYEPQTYATTASQILISK